MPPHFFISLGIASDVESLALLFDPNAYAETDKALSRIVLVLVIGLSIHAASAYQIRKNNEDGKVQPK